MFSLLLESLTNCDVHRIQTHRMHVDWMTAVVSMSARHFPTETQLEGQ